MNPTLPDHDLPPRGALPVPAPEARAVVPRPAPASPAPVAAGLTVADLLHAFERRRLLVVLGGLLCGAACAGLAFLVVPPPRYTVKAMVHVASVPMRIIFQTSESIPDYRSFQRTQAALAKSRKVLTAALRAPEVAGLRSIPADGDAGTWLDQELKVDFPGGAEIMTFSMTAADSREATILVNASCDAYLKQIVDEDRRQRIARNDALQALFNKFQDDLREKRKTYRAAVEDVGVTDKLSVAARQQAATSNLGLLQAELTQIQAETRQLERRARVAAARRDRADEGPEPVDEALVEGAVGQDTAITDLRRQGATLRAELGRARQTARDLGDPSVRRVRERLDANERALRARVEQVRAAAGRAQGREVKSRDEAESVEAERSLAILKDQEALLREQVAALAVDLKSGNVKTLDMHWLDDEIALASQSARTVGSEVEALKVELTAPPRIRLIEHAEAPTMTDPTRRQKISGGAGMAGLALFAGAVILLEARTRRVGSPDDVVHGLGIRLIGSIPARPKSPQIGKAQETWQRMLIESVDSARTLILHASRLEPLKIIAVVSAVKGEGKTTLACLLAASLQRAGRRTLLVDGDLRCPAIHRLMDITPGAGLCEVLRGELPVERAIVPVAGPGVDFLPAGRLDADALQGLVDGRLAGLIQDLGAQYDQVIVDTAPTLYVPDGQIMAQYADAAVMAVLRGVSQGPKVHHAHERLAELGVRVLGAVVGGARGEGPRSYSYQYARGSLEDRNGTA